MRNKILTQWLLCALGLWLLSQQCGQCFYDPGSQRWINRDPIGEDGGNNLLCFVFNNPANYLDGRGLEAGYRYNSDGTMTAPQGADREPFTPPPYPNPTTSPPMAPPGGNVEWDPYSGQWGQHSEAGAQTEDWILLAGSSAVCSRFATGAGYGTAPETAESLSDTEAARAALGKGPNASPGAPLTRQMRDALQKNKEAAQKTLDNANKGLSRSGKPISPEQAAKVQKTMQDRINNVNNILQSGCQGGKN